MIASFGPSDGGPKSDGLDCGQFPWFRQRNFDRSRRRNGRIFLRSAAALQTGQLRIAAVVAQSRFDTGDRRGTGLRIWKSIMRSVRSDAGLPIPCT